MIPRIAFVSERLESINVQHSHTHSHNIRITDLHCTKADTERKGKRTPMSTKRQQYNKSKSTHTDAYFILNAQIMVR